MDHEAVDAVEPRVCGNCQTELTGEYCHNCGQHEMHHHAWSMKHFLHEAWHEIGHLDSKIFRTLKLLLFQPGEMTRQYLDGHRQPFVNPIRLYLVMTALFFFFGAQTDFSIEGFQRTGSASGLTLFVQKAAESKNIPYEVELKSFNEGFHKKFSILIGIGVLVYALMVHWMYRKTEHWYTRSLIFSLHFFSLFFALLLFWRLVLHYMATSGFKAPMPLFFVLILLFLALSIRRVWRDEPAKRWIPKLLFLWLSSFLVYTMSIGLGIGLQIFGYGQFAARAFSR